MPLCFICCTAVDGGLPEPGSTEYLPDLQDPVSILENGTAMVSDELLPEDLPPHFQGLRMLEASAANCTLCALLASSIGSSLATLRSSDIMSEHCVQELKESAIWLIKRPDRADGLVALVHAPSSLETLAVAAIGFGAPDGMAFARKRRVLPIT